MKPDITIIDRGPFWGYDVLPVSSEGIYFCKKYKRGIEMKRFSVCYAMFNDFYNLALNGQLVIETEF